MRKPTIGILAGMGPRSTAPFIDMVVTECQRQHGARHDIDFPKMMICSQPAPFYEDRPVDHSAMEAAILDGLHSLEWGGADFLAIACNTAHIYYPRLIKRVNVPLLSIVEATLAAIPPTVSRPTLLAARPTVEAGIYQAGMRARGLMVAEVDWQDQVDALLGATRTTADPAYYAQQWTAFARQASVAGADAIVVACLDLSTTLAHAPACLPLVDAAQCLAKEVVRYWGLGVAA